MKNWFDVDRHGLARLLGGRGPGYLLCELIQNAWDQSVTRVEITLKYVARRRLAELIVTDDDPDGFRDLRHAFTLFTPSAKADDPVKRGRFNVGEKFVLARCRQASIASTTGAVEFDESGRHSRRVRRASGSQFHGLLPMTREELDSACRTVSTLIVPPGVVTRFNASVLPSRCPVRTVDAVLPTEIMSDGVLRPTKRRTQINLYEPLAGEIASVYEMGIPVVETGDRWHYDVGQKVPLGMSRDNVPPSFLRRLRVAVLNAAHNLLKTEDANSAWVRESMADPDCSPEAVRTCIALRFGERRVSSDPSDPAASRLAVSRGYVVVHGAQLSAGEWDSVRRAGAILPAGQVTPSPKVYSDDPAAPPEVLIPPTEWTEGMRRVVSYSRMLGRELLTAEIEVRITEDLAVPAEAAYGHSADKRHGRLMFNAARLGRTWFESGITEAVDALLLHEFAHHYESDHLSSAYHEAICRLGARLKQVALAMPALFAESMSARLPPN